MRSVSSMHLLQSSPVRKVATLLRLTHPSNFFLFLRQRRDYDSLFKFPALLKYGAKRLKELTHYNFPAGAEFLCFFFGRLAFWDCSWKCATNEGCENEAYKTKKVLLVDVELRRGMWRQISKSIKHSSKCDGNCRAVNGIFFSFLISCCVDFGQFFFSRIKL